MLTTIINSILPSQRICVYKEFDSEVVYEGRNDQFLTSTHGVFTDYTLLSIYTTPTEDVIYVYITE